MSALYDLLELRTAFLKRFKAEVLYQRSFTKALSSRVDTDAFPPEQQDTTSVADVSNYISSRIGWEWGNRLPGQFGNKIQGQTAGNNFTAVIRDFLNDSLTAASDLGRADFRTSMTFRKTSKMKSSKKSIALNPKLNVSEFSQYLHLKDILTAFNANQKLESVFGSDYIVEPDIVVFREPFSVNSLGGRPKGKVATYSPLLSDEEGSAAAPSLHASVSCKLTLRSDRAQNARLEALNLIRLRKGRVPHIAFLTAEPLPSRLASIALGTGDIDCIYHVGLYELIESMDEVVDFSLLRLPDDMDDRDPRYRKLAVMPEDPNDNDKAARDAPPTKKGVLFQRSRLMTMIDQGRLRDISDLALDLLI